MKQLKTSIDARTLGIQPQHLSPGARFVIDTLHQHKQLAYVVGGGVRDLLAGIPPKDFDIATDAHPEMIKTIFKQRCLLIGRRFRLAHIRFQREVLEVSTFRASPSEEQTSTRIDQHGLVVRDNTFGSLEEDALRRDFTVNALYYNPNAHQIIDFFDGLKDVQQRQLRIIGDPLERYQQDPVRLLRAIRLSCKLGFTWVDKSLTQLNQVMPLLAHIPAPRLFDEWLKLFLAGHAKITLQALQQNQLLIYVLPLTAIEWSEPCHQALVIKAAQDTDSRLASGKSVTPAFLLAAFLWHPLLKQLRSNTAACKSTTDNLAFKRIPFYQQLELAMDQILAQQLPVLSIPKRFTQPMKEIWALQFRLDQRRGQRAYRLFENPRFRAAYDFLLLREYSQELQPGLGAWWTDFQQADTAQQHKMIQTLSAPKHPQA